MASISRMMASVARRRTILRKRRSCSIMVIQSQRNRQGFWWLPGGAVDDDPADQHLALRVAQPGDVAGRFELVQAERDVRRGIDPGGFHDFRSGRCDAVVRQLVADDAAEDGQGPGRQRISCSAHHPPRFRGTKKTRNRHPAG